MRNTKEAKIILSALYCINLAKREKADKDIEMICKYAFDRLFDSNLNLLILSCVGKDENQILQEVKQMMYQETKYKNFEEWKRYQEKIKNEQ